MLKINCPNCGKIVRISIKDIFHVRTATCPYCAEYTLEKYDRFSRFLCASFTIPNAVFIALGKNYLTCAGAGKVTSIMVPTAIAAIVDLVLFSLVMLILIKFNALLKRKKSK